MNRGEEFIGKLDALLPDDEPAGLAGRLIEFETENPPGNEGPAIEQLTRVLDDWGFDTQVYFTDFGRSNLVAQIGWGKRKRRLILNGHLDVVPAGDHASWRRPPYIASLEDGRLYGRGSADMKGGVAAMMWGVRLVTLAGIEPQDAEVVLHLVSDEETGGLQGTEWLIGHVPFEAEAAIVGEPTDLNVVVAGKGALWSRLTVKGKPAHGSVPHLGVNAIEKMARLIVRLGDLELPGDHPLLGGATLNVGTITGGSKINVVADSCSIEVDRRVLPGETKETVEAEFRRAIETLGRQEDADAAMEVTLFAEPFEIDPDQRIVRAALSAVEAVTGDSRQPKGARGFTDARFYAGQCGMPAIILGPGSISQAHTANEFVWVSQLRDAAVIYALIIADFLSG